MGYDHGVVKAPACWVDLICLMELAEAFEALERVRRDCKISRNRLMTVREALDSVLDEAFRRQSFGPIERLLEREETALAEYQQAAAKLARAEQRWCAVRAALAYESQIMGSAPAGPQCLN
jgi:hypothetical protein